MKKEFKPGTYIVTAEGNRGYIIQRVPKTNMYEIRLASGYSVRSHKDLQILIERMFRFQVILHKRSAGYA